MGYKYELCAWVRRSATSSSSPEPPSPLPRDFSIGQVYHENPDDKTNQPTPPAHHHSEKRTGTAFMR